jgi:hypothetical protein
MLGREIKVSTEARGIDSISGLDATIKILAEQYRWTKNKLS